MITCSISSLVTKSVQNYVKGHQIPICAALCTVY